MNCLYMNIATLFYLMVNNHYFYKTDNILITIFLFINFLLGSLVLLKINRRLKNYSIIFSIVLFVVVLICIYIIQSFFLTKIGISLNKNSKNYEESIIFYYSKYIYSFIIIFAVFSLLSLINSYKACSLKELLRFIYYNELKKIYIYIKESKKN